MNKSARPSAGVVGNALKTLREHANTSFGFAALLCLPIAFAGTNSSLNPGVKARAIEQAVSLLAGVLVTYGSMVAFRRYEQGSDPGVGGLLKQTFSPALFSFVITRGLVGLALALALAIGMLPFLLAAFSSPEIFTTQKPPAATLASVGGALVLSVPVAIALFLWVFLQLGLSAPANVLEKLSPARSIARSGNITKGKKSDFFMVMVALVMVRLALSVLLAGPGAIVGGGPEPLDVNQTVENPFLKDRFLDMVSQQEPLGLAAAVIVGLSAYLGSVAILVVSATVFAQFFLALRGPLPRSEEAPPDPAGEQEPNK